MAAPGVLGNDSDPNSKPLTAVLVSPAAHGVLMLNANGSFSYTPDPTAAGKDTFRYKASNGSQESNAAKVEIEIGPQLNHDPVAVDDEYMVGHGQTLTVAAPGVLTNDTDADHDALTAELVSPPQHGTVTLAADGSFTYHHDGSNSPNDHFTYRVSDGHHTSNTATVTLSIGNDVAPVATNDVYTVAEGGVLVTSSVNGLFANDHDADTPRSQWSVVIVTQPAHGTLTMGTGGGFTYTHDGSETTADVFTYKVSDGIRQSNTATVSITVTPVNDAPVVHAATFSLPENSANGTVVGTVTSSDAESATQTYTYAITGGNSLGAFAINAVSGQITVADTTKLDFETTPQFNLTVTVTDSGTPVQSGSATIHINLTNVNEAPVASNATFAVAENSPAGTAVGTVTASDPDAGTTLSYAITGGNAGNAFAINAAGQITVNGPIDFESLPSYTLTVTVTDNGVPQLGTTATITVNVTDVNEVPVVTGASFSLPENTANGTNVGSPITYADPDGGQTHVYSIESGNTNNAFAIDPSTGQITVNNVGALDFETTPVFTLTVRVTDNGTPVLFGQATVTVTLTNVNEQPTDIALSGNAVAENQPVGTPVGNLSTTDVDAGDTFTYTLVSGTGSTDNGVFQIVGNQLQTNAVFDFETQASYSIRVRSTDAGSLFTEKQFTITITDANDAPVVTAATFAVNENVPSGTTVGTVTYTDQDGSQTHTFAITGGNTGGAFAIDSSTGVITTAGAINFETLPSYSLTVTVTDNGSPVLNGSNTITINVNDVNEVPVVNAATFTVNENAANGTAVGTATFSDPDAGQTHVFAITAGNTGNVFSIDPSTGAITVAGAIDFETTSSYSLTVQVTDNGTPNLSGTATITVNVNDVNEVPVVNAATFAMNENVPAGTTVGTVTFTDPDGGQTHAFSITGGNTGGAFTINAATGVITTAGAIDFETTPSYSLTVQVTETALRCCRGRTRSRST